MSYRFSPGDGEGVQRRNDVLTSQTFYDRHPPGSAIELAYDSDDPARSSPVVLLGSARTPSTQLLAFLTIMAGGAAGMLLGHRLRRPTGWRRYVAFVGLALGLGIGLLVGLSLFDVLAWIIF